MSEEKLVYDIERIRRENTILRQYAAMQRANEEKLGCPKIYVDMVGEIEAALILDELVFFTLPSDKGKSMLRIWKDGYLWMAVKRSEWWDRKRLTERQADRAISKLVDADFIVSNVYKFNGINTVHIRLNTETFMAAYFTQLNKDNPQETEESDPTELSDLYEMMGISGLPNGDLDSRLPKSNERLPFGDARLPNGEIINSIDSLTTNINKKLSRSEIQAITDEANKDVDARLDFERQAQEAKAQGKAWRGRELLRPDYLLYADLWHSLTGLEMYGAKAKPKADSEWQNSCKVLWENEVTETEFREAYKAETWEGKRTLTRMSQVLGTAKAIHAAGSKESVPDVPQGVLSMFRTVE